MEAAGEDGGESPILNLAPFGRKVLHRGSCPSGVPQSCLPVRNMQKGASSLAGQADCSALTLEGGIPPSSNLQHFRISQRFRSVKSVISYLLLISLFAPYPVLGMGIREIRVKGERAISQQEVKRALALEEGANYSSQEIAQGVERVLARYEEMGYLSAKVTTELEEDEILILDIEEGSLTLVGKVWFEGQSFFTAGDLFLLLETRPRKRFNQGILRGDIERIIELYENWGFPFCEVGLSDWQMEGEKVNICFHIMEGPRVRIERIQVEGNRKTKDSFIKRVSGITVGDYFAQRKLETAQRRLEKTGLFLKVEKPWIRILGEPQRGEVIFRTEERRNNQAEGFLGYSPSSKGGMSGNLLLSLGNIGGTGRRAELRWLRIGPGDSEIGFGYREPFFLNLPFSLGGRLEEKEKRGQFNRIAASLYSDGPLRGQIDWGVIAGWERVIWDDSSLSMRRYNLGTEISLDTRDYPPNPRRGIFYLTSFTYGWRRDYPPGESSPRKGWNTRIVSDLSFFLSPLPEQALNLRLHLAQVKGDQSAIPLSDQFFLGGARTIRGYQEEAAHGTLVSWLNLEYRFLLGRLSRIYPFLDYGHFRFPGGEDRMWGYGFGLSVGSKQGIMGLDIGWGRGASLGQAKLHLRLVNNF